MTLSELDLSIVTAVQTAPRVPWVDVASTLDVAPTTVARRWAALLEAGEAWTGTTVGSAVLRGAVIELSTSPGRSAAVVEALTAMPDVYTIGSTLGEYDLYALSVGLTATRVRETYDRVAALPVQRLRFQLSTRVFAGPRWTLNALDPQQAEQVRERLGSVRGPVQRVDALDAQLFDVLSADARLTFEELGERLGIGATAAAARLRKARRRGVMDLRADVARPLAGWPWAALLWVRVPDGEVARVGRSIGESSQVRLCAPVVGPAALVVVVNLRSPDELEPWCARLVAGRPGVEVVDRRMILQLHKVLGHVLDDDGRRTGVVPMRPWG